MTTRKSLHDNELLEWVRRRANGENPKDIAPQTPDYCRAATNRVRQADVSESGLSDKEAVAVYW